MDIRLPAVVTMSMVLAGCGHDCARHGPAETRWAQEIACYEHTQLDDRPPVSRVGCYRLALAPSYLTNASTGPERLFLDNPEFVELTADWYTKEVRTGYLVRTPPRSSGSDGTGVWWPTRDGGALIDLATGFAGMMLRMHRSGVGLSGTASTYQDVGDESQRSTAELWPVGCDKMPREQGK